MERSTPASPGQKMSPAQDRRRSRRVEVTWDVRGESLNRVQWQGEIVSFGPFGLTLRVEANDPGLLEGAVVRLKFVPPDGEFPLSLEGIVCRVDPDGLAITFINLRSATFERLKQLVDTLSGEAA